MAISLPSKGNSFPPPAARDRLRDLASFRTTYVAIVGFVFLYVFSVQGAESLLQRHLHQAVQQAATDSSSVGEIRRDGRSAVNGSGWVRVGGVLVTAIVLGADGSPVYAGALPVPPAAVDPVARAHEAERIFPVTVDVTVSVPHNSLLANGVLVLYAGVLLTGLYLYQAAVTSRQEALMAGAVSARDAAAKRAGKIQRELEGVRRRLRAKGVAENQEVEALRSEREALHEKLESLERREEELLSEQVSGEEALDSEHQALEELLDEALADLQSKDEEIDGLETRLKRASKDAAAAAGTRARDADTLSRRLRTLYKNLEVDDRALSDLVTLGDESTRLRAEEMLKRLSDDVETAGARRKVGGLPPGITVFELGFAGKGRIYYTHGSQRRLRILLVGAKNSQKKDLEHLSRIETA